MRTSSTTVSEPAVLQEELRCCTRPLQTPEHSYAVSRPYFTPRTTSMQFEALSSRQRRSNPAAADAGHYTWLRH
jgi:hypothetical protein